MTSESKILTVSYGTFSCTLEGFDDPFNTMKAIAEYFRDLTAEDRYFGAEPPQPDAAMLHRIAEREVSRLVDARVRENGVHLRPQDGAAPAAAAPVAPAATGLDDAAPAPAEPTLQDAIPNGVAAKLARIRQSVNPQPFTADLPAEALAAFLDEETPVADVADLTAAAAAAEDDLQTTADAEDFSRTALSQLDALLRAPADEPAPAADADATAEAVAEADLAADADPMADWVADEEGAAPFLDAAELEEVADPAPVTEFTATLPEESPDLAASLVEAMQDDPLPESFAPDDTAAEADLSPEAAMEDLAPEAVADAPAPVEEAKPAGRSKRVNSRVVRLHPGNDADAEDDDPQSSRMLAGGDDAEVARLLRQADDVMADDENRRRIDSIAHLKAAVAATEADRAVTGEAKPAPGTDLDPYRDVLAQVVQPGPENAPQVKPRRKTVSIRPQEPRPGSIRPGMMGPPPLVLVSEQRIDRVPVPPVAQPDAARPDAAQAGSDVLDRRAPDPVAQPVVAQPTAPQPAAPQPTPATPRDGQPMVALRTGRLTGAIGIGASAASPIAPQQKIVLDQPSQGASADADDEEDHDEDLTAAELAGLVDFAERVGVKSMAEMLEAAAAYATCIEKRSQFTRPQLMRRLMASAGDRTVSREDGLRSFGTLLRTGRIEKVSRGHYMLAESSPYLAEARRLS